MGPRIRVVLGAVDEQPVDATVVPVMVRRAAVGDTGIREVGNRHVIEVRPPTSSRVENREHLLARAYRAVLAAADDIGAHTIAIPTELTCSPWPIDAALRVALGTIESTPTRVQLVL